MSYANIGIIILIAFVISVVITKYEIPFLRAKAGQNIREDGPESHLSKAGTPSMGGIAIIIGQNKLMNIKVARLFLIANLFAKI